MAAACYPAVVLTLLISDVPGDNPIDIASGPTVADPTTCANARAIIDRYRIELPPAVRALLQRAEGESVKPGDARLARAETRMITAPQMALEAAAQVARAAGITPYILGDSLEGEARDLGKAGATSHSCWRSAWRWTDWPACTRWPAIPTAWTGRKKLPVRCWRPTRSRGPGRRVSTPAPAWTPTTATASSRRWAIR